MAAAFAWKVDRAVNFATRLVNRVSARTRIWG